MNATIIHLYAFKPNSGPGRKKGHLALLPDAHLTVENMATATAFSKSFQQLPKIQFSSKSNITKKFSVTLIPKLF